MILFDEEHTRHHHCFALFMSFYCAAATLWLFLQDRDSRVSHPVTLENTIFLNTEIVRLLVVSNKFSQKTKFPTSEVPLYYLHGSRRLSVIHARLRNNCRDLKHDLFNNYVSTLFKCRRYYTHRVDLFTTKRILLPLNIKRLLYEDSAFANAKHVL